MDTLYGQQACDKVFELIRDIRVAQMATYDEKTQILHARPMMAQHAGQAEFDGLLWFFTSTKSRKADELRGNPQVLLTYADPAAQKYVSISGTATIVHDQAKIDELWTDYAEVWFPQGKDDFDLALIRFEAEDAEFWHVPGGTLAAGFGYIKAFMTGDEPKVGEAGQVHLQHH